MRRPLPGLLLLAVGCGGAELAASPTSLQWGEVDFQLDRPAEGYDARAIAIRNDGKRALVPEVTAFDDFHLVLGAPLLGESLDGGQQMIITVGVGDYDIAGGERDTEVAGTFRIDADGLDEAVVVDWAFVPVRHIAVDTGAR